MRGGFVGHGSRRGAVGVRALPRGLIEWRAAANWYVFAASFTVIVKLTVAVIYRLAMSAWPRFGADPWYMIPLAITFFHSLSGLASFDQFRRSRLGRNQHHRCLLMERILLPAARVSTPDPE